MSSTWYIWLQHHLNLFLESHFYSWLGFILALLVLVKLLNEKRHCSHIFSWVLLIFFLPWIGVPLYFLLGGRKSNRMVANKQRIWQIATKVVNDKIAGDSQTVNPDTMLRHSFAHNQVDLLADGVATFNALCQQINQAKQSIHMMTYILGPDATGKQIIKLLAEKARQGVEVKLLLDAVGSFGRTLRFTKPIYQSGGQVLRFMPVLPLLTGISSNLRNHRKLAIFDGERAIIGGQNIDKRFMGAAPDNKRFEDFSILIKGPILQVFNRVFISDWCFASREDPLKYQQLMAKGPAANGDEHLEVRASGPDIQGDPLWEKLITLVQDCQQSMTLVTPYFVPDEVLFHSLLVKAKTGRQVRLMVPKQSNHRLVDLARHRYLRELARAGVDILLYRPRMLHAKLCIIDDRVAMIGSANLDMRSLFVNFEVGVFLTSTNSINQLQAWFNDRVKDCMPFARNGKLNVSEPRLFMEHLAHLLIPLL